MAELSLNPMRVVAAGLGGAVAAGALAGVAVVGTGALLPTLLLAQVVLALAWTAYADAPAPLPTVGILVASAVAADVLAVRDDGRGAAATIGVLAAAFVVAVAASLVDRNRTRVSEGLAITVTGALLVVLTAQLLAVEAGRLGGVLVAVALTAVGCSLAVARLIDAGVGGPPVVAGSQRGLLGVAVGLVVAAGTGMVLGAAHAPLSRISGLLVCAAAAAAALVADLAIELGTHAAVEERARSAARPLAALVPLCAAAPVVFALSRLLIA